MSEQIECPVCGKVGIPDYHKEEIVCPCCGTNLSIYKMLTDYQGVLKPQKKANNKIWKTTTAASAAVVVLVMVFVCLPSKEVVKDVELSKMVKILNDSIATLTHQLDLTNQEIASFKAQSTVNSDNIYIVKKNDSPCRISRKLYGTESRYKEIEAIIAKPLQPGDTLKLK